MANRLLYFIRQVSAKAMTDIKSVMAATMNADRVNLFTRFTPPLVFINPGGSAHLHISSRAATGNILFPISP